MVPNSISPLTIITYDMNTAETGPSGGRDSRGQSAVLGLVLLIGIVAMASVGILVYADQSTTDVQQETENERIESAFVELSKTMGTTASTGDTVELVDFAAGEHGAIVKSNAGTIEIVGGDENSSYYVNETFEIGAIEYQADDGTRIAYQAGGVFRETGNESQVVSAPPIHYDFATETFTFPIVETTGDKTQLDSGEIVIRHNETHPYRHAVYVQDDSVDINITSPYYRSWETYFERQAGSASVRNVKPINETYGSVEVRIGYLEIEEAFGTGVAYAYELDDHNNPQIDDYEQANFPELDDVIYEIVDDIKDEHDAHLGTVDEQVTLDNGSYYSTGIDESGHLQFDLSEGNATLVVDGDMKLNDTGIEVTDRDPDGKHHLNVYVTGDYDASQSGNVCVTEDGDGCYENYSATAIRIIGTSETRVVFGGGGNPRLEGVIYAGSSKQDWETISGAGGGQCEHQVCLLSNPDIYGAIIASSVDAHSSAIEFEYAEELRDADINLYPDDYTLPPQLTYLNLALHEVDVEQR